MTNKFILLFSGCLLFFTACNSNVFKDEAMEDHTDTLPNQNYRSLQMKDAKSKITQSLKDLEKNIVNGDDYSITKMMNLFSKDKDITVINAYGGTPSSYGWAIGSKEIKKLLIYNSSYWATFSLTYEKLNINFNKSMDTAWISIPGFCLMSPKLADKFIELGKLIKDNIEENNNSILRLVFQMNYQIFFNRNKEGIPQIPFALTAIYTKEKVKIIPSSEFEKKWLIQQLHYSVPVDTRGLDSLNELKGI